MVKACIRNIYYSKMVIHNTTHNYDTGSLSHFFGGEAVHQLLDSSAQGMGEQMMWYNFVEDKPVKLFKKGWELSDEAKAWDVEDWLKILVGERDAIYPVKLDGVEQKVLVDYKTMMSNGFVKRSASPEHVEQLNIYRYLSKRMLDEDIEYGAVIYLDFADKLAKPKIFVVKLNPVDETHAMLVSKYAEMQESLESGTLPPRTKTWLCDGYCSYASRCFTEETLDAKENKLKVVT